MPEKKQKTFVDKIGEAAGSMMAFAPSTDRNKKIETRGNRDYDSKTETIRGATPKLPRKSVRKTVRGTSRSGGR